MSDSIESPIIEGGIVFPKLTNRSIGIIAAKCQAAMVAKAKAQIAKEQASAEGKDALLLRYVVEDYAIEHVHEWSRSIDGSRVICEQSLRQGGIPEAEAVATVDSLRPAAWKRIAMEAVDHPQSESRIAKARAEWEAKTKEEQESAKNPPAGE